MRSVTYTRYEVLRTVRNRRFFIFSLIFPLVLFYLVAGSNRHAHVEGIIFPLYYMTGMMGFGTMIAVVSCGARLSFDRSLGWSRQMRITPLTTRAYFSSKLVTSYIMAAISIVLISAAGLSLAVHLPLLRWGELIGLVLVALAPFAVLGILLGSLLKADTMGPVQGGVVTIMALLGGSFGNLFPTGILHRICELLPSYWLVQSAVAALTGKGWALEGWIVVMIWTAALAALARLAYIRDTARV